MASQHPHLWHQLGLSVAIGFAGLGFFCFIAPQAAGTSMGLMSAQTNTDPEVRKLSKNAMYWIGARDLSIATALFAFHYQDKPVEMGTLILSGTVFFVVDSVLVYRYRKGDAFSIAIAVGAMSWVGIGWKLLQL